MATEQPSPAFLDEQTAVDRIQAIVGNARTVWFALLAFLAFIGLALTSVRDLDFFSATATTQLPIVNIAIPTTTFFWSAAWLAAVLHTYFHLYLLKLWDVLAEAPPEIGGAPLGDRVFPWLVVDWALRRRPDRPTTRRPMDWLSGAVTWLIIWLATPLLLAAFWWRSMPAHAAWLSLLIAAALLVSLYATLSGWLRAKERLAQPGLQPREESLSGQAPALPEAWWQRGTILTLVLLAVSLARTQLYLPWSLVAPIDLVGAEVVGRPADWVGRDTAARRFRISWCRDRQIPVDACELPTETYHSAARGKWCAERPIEDCAAVFEQLDTAFDEEWREQRREYLANLTSNDLAGRDLRDANASGAFLAGIDLRGARLEGADFGGARLEGANLREARLEGWTNLSEARLEGADLSGAQLTLANLTGARLEGANLRKAQLARARLSEARLNGADLREAQLEGANLREAQLEGANLSSAALEGANLSAAGLEEANLREARLDGAELGWARLEGTDLRKATLEGAVLRAARLEGANLGEANLEGANLREAKLGGANLLGAALKAANLSEAALEGTNLIATRLQSAEWAGATFAASPAHFADLSGGRNLVQGQLAQVIGDGDTILPLDAETGDQLYVWICWLEPPPTLDGLLRDWHPDDQPALRALWLCNEGRSYPRPEGDQPRRTGRPAAPAPGYPLAD